MAIEPGVWRVEDLTWNDIMDLWNAESVNRGITDPFGMLMLLQDIWELLSNGPARTQQLSHEKYTALEKQIQDIQGAAQDLQDKLDAMGPDPGPATR